MRETSCSGAHLLLVGADLVEHLGTEQGLDRAEQHVRLEEALQRQRARLRVLGHERSVWVCLVKVNHGRKALVHRDIAVFEGWRLAARVDCKQLFVGLVLACRRCSY